MNVSATVVARAVISIENQPPAVTVTAEDVQRGFVEFAAPIVVRVRTNSRGGYLLQAEKRGDAFSAIELTAATITMRVTSQHGSVQRPYIAGGDVVAFRGRIELAPGCRPGTYPLPLSLAASPL